jgi:hypothetical protein
VGAAGLHVLHGGGCLVAGFLGGAGGAVVGAEAMGPAILAWLRWPAVLGASLLVAASLLVVSALIATAASSAVVVAAAVVAVVAVAVVAISIVSVVLLDFGLEVGDSRHEGLHLGHHGLVLMGGGRDICEMYLELLIG